MLSPRQGKPFFGAGWWGKPPIQMFPRAGTPSRDLVGPAWEG